ncbi:MAG: protein phosphatase CheZ [Nitrospirae bacterium]|nr:protein phosphatase CheZ [Nitrospirota bacterium]
MKYIGFLVNGNEYTVPINKVQEIINLPQITQMPQSPPYVEGITNIRGKIITIVKLRKFLGFPDKDGPQKVIVLASGRVAFGILVDGITGVISIEDSNIEHAETFMDDTGEAVDGVAKIDDRLIIMLDPKKMIPHQDMHFFEDEIIEYKEAGEDKVEVVKKVEGIGGDIFVREIMDTKEFFKNKGIAKNDPRVTVLDELVCFMDALVSQDFEKTNACVENIISKGQEGLYKELGKLTRKLHDAIQGFKGINTPRLKSMTVSDMPNALDNLQLVIKGTEDAANRTLEIVEKYFARMKGSRAEIQGFTGKQDAVDYMEKFREEFEKDLTELLIIQEFQDLTGRTLKQVIGFMEETENEMVKIIGTFGLKAEKGERETKIREEISQEGVDSLLKGLGF